MIAEHLARPDAVFVMSVYMFRLRMSGQGVTSTLYQVRFIWPVLFRHINSSAVVLEI